MVLCGLLLLIHETIRRRKWSGDSCNSKPFSGLTFGLFLPFFLCAWLSLATLFCCFFTSPFGVGRPSRAHMRVHANQTSLFEIGHVGFRAPSSSSFSRVFSGMVLGVVGMQVAASSARSLFSWFRMVLVVGVPLGTVAPSVFKCSMMSEWVGPSPALLLGCG